MTLILDTPGTNSLLGRIIDDAQKHILLISPSLNVNGKMRERLERAVSRGVSLFIIHSKGDADEDTLDWVKGLDNSNVACVADLHVRLYMSENGAIVSTMDVSDYDEMNHEEIGVIFDRRSEKQEYKDLLLLALYLVGSSEIEYGAWDTTEVERFMRGPMGLDISQIVQSKTPRRTCVTTESITVGRAPTKCHCIRCGRQILVDSGIVYCDRCFKSWSKRGNLDFVEITGYCHVCGEPYRASAKKSVCINCLYRYGDHIKGKTDNMIGYSKE